MNVISQELVGEPGSVAENTVLRPLRPLIFHYHIFKNAGSSVDEILIRNFGPYWDQAEFRTPVNESNVDDVAEYLGKQSRIVAFSSHTAQLPAPLLPGVFIFPIIFVRHPIDRIRSAYQFEKKQAADTYGSKLARDETFEGYLRHLIKHTTDRTARNFQTYRIAQNEPSSLGSEAKRAFLAIERLPFVGLVEAFDQSLVRLEGRLKLIFSKFQVHSVKENVTREISKPLQLKLDEIEEEIGKDLYAELCTANADDLELFRRVQRTYEMTYLFQYGGHAL